MISKKSIPIFDIVNFFFLLLVAVVTLYPFVNTLAISFNDGLDAMRGGISVWPRLFTLDNYIVVLVSKKLYTAFGVTLARTLLSTVLATLFTGIVAYGMSKQHLKGRKLYMTLCLITMYFNGGMIPNFLLMRTLGLTDNFLVYVIPGLLNVFNMIMMITYYRGLPVELEEAAKIDGCSEFRILFTIIFPVSMPIIAVIALYNAVGNWNSWFDAYLYVTNPKLQPLQIVLRDIINASNLTEMMPSQQTAAANIIRNLDNVSTRTITAATTMVTIGPIVLCYPFLQRYFVKGVLIGSVKG